MAKLDKFNLVLKPEGYVVRLLIDKVNELEDRIATLEETNENRI